VEGAGLKLAPRAADTQIASGGNAPGSAVYHAASSALFPAARAGPPASETVQVPHLLIIDDERPLRTAVRRWFTRRGWTCGEAASVAEAEQRIFASGATVPDAILCDLNLPDGTAETLITRLRRERAGLTRRLVLATGEVLGTDVEAQLADLGCAVLPKPFDLAQLESAIHRAQAQPAPG
jgi:CheY-like chemotaxis protein